MLKKFVSLVVGVSLALATIGVAAADPAVQTQSVYDASAKTLTVVTTVTNPEDGSTYTYLAYDKDVTTIADLEAGQIKYVDQKVYNEANGTNLAFEFETTTNDSAKLYQDIIKVGGKTAAGAAYTAATSGVGENIVDPTVTVNGEAATATFGTYVSADIADTDYVEITTASLNNIVTGITYVKTSDSSTVTVDDYIYADKSVWLKKSDIVAASSIAIAAAEQSLETRTLDIGYIAQDTADGAEVAPAVIAVGQVQGPSIRTYGIIFSKNSDFSNSVALTAVGRGTDGKYAIKIRNFKDVKTYKEVEGEQVIDADLTDAEKIYAKTYYTYWTDDEHTTYSNAYGAPFVVDVTATEGWVNGSKFAVR